jgi:hypothetical protein
MMKAIKAKFRIPPPKKKNYNRKLMYFLEDNILRDFIKQMLLIYVQS